MAQKLQQIALGAIFTPSLTNSVNAPKKIPRDSSGTTFALAKKVPNRDAPPFGLVAVSLLPVFLARKFFAPGTFSH
jgi:hypothetical protein